MRVFPIISLPGAGMNVCLAARTHAFYTYTKKNDKQISTKKEGPIFPVLLLRQRASALLFLLLYMYIRNALSIQLVLLLLLLLFLICFVLFYFLR